MDKKRWVFAALAALMFGTSQAYPDKPIKLIVPFAPGGPTDVVARIFAETASQELGQPIVVENRPGAGGGLGTSMLARMPADGYTLGIAAVSTHVVNPSCNENVDYDPVQGFTHLAMVADMPMVWVEQPDTPATGFKEVIDSIKKQPGKFTQGTPGVCSLGHMLLERINDEMGLEIRHVPYKGSAPAMADFLGKNLDFSFDVESLIIPQIQAGRAVPFAVSWPTRIKSLPEVPTLSELGYPDLKLRPWYGVVGPADLPDDVKRVLLGAIEKTMANQGLHERFMNAGMIPVQDVMGDDFERHVRTEFEDSKAFLQRKNISASS